MFISSKTNFPASFTCKQTERRQLPKLFPSSNLARSRGCREDDAWLYLCPDIGQGAGSSPFNPLFIIDIQNTLTLLAFDLPLTAVVASESLISSSSCITIILIFGENIKEEEILSRTTAQNETFPFTSGCERRRKRHSRYIGIGTQNGLALVFSFSLFDNDDYLFRLRRRHQHRHRQNVLWRQADQEKKREKLCEKCLPTSPRVLYFSRSQTHTHIYECMFDSVSDVYIPHPLLLQFDSMRACLSVHKRCLDASQIVANTSTDKCLAKHVVPFNLLHLISHACGGRDVSKCGLRRKDASDRVFCMISFFFVLQSGSDFRLEWITCSSIYCCSSKFIRMKYSLQIHLRYVDTHTIPMVRGMSRFTWFIWYV